MIELEKEPLQEKILYDNDKTDNNREFFEFAILGTATSSAYWKILRISYSGNDWTLEWADNGEYTAIWDNRVTESYT